MKGFIFYILLTGNIYVSGAFPLVFNKTDENIIYDLIKEFQIRHCILFVNDIGSENVNTNIKKISSLNVFAIVFDDYARLAQYVWNFLYKNEKRYCNIMIIITENNRLMVEKMFKIYHNVKESKLLSKIKWIMFVSDVTNLGNWEIRNIIPHDCEFMVVETKNPMYNLMEIYSVKNITFNFQYGEWDLNQGLQFISLSLYWRRLNLNRTKLETVITNKDDANSYCGYSNCKINEMIDDFSKMMNFQNVHVLVSHEKFELELSQRDILGQTWGNPIQITTDRIGPTFISTLNWYIKHPDTRLRSDYYLQPFDKNVWLSFIFSMTIVNIFIVIVTRNFVCETENKSSLLDDILVGLETFCNQSGSSFEYKNNSLRISCLILRIISYIAVASFGAVITSFLTVEIPQVSFRNVEEFLENGAYRLLVVNRTTPHGTLENIGNKAVQNMYKNFTELTAFNPVIKKMYENNLKRICQEENFAVPMENSDIFSRFNQFLECNIFKIHQPIAFDYEVLRLTEDSPFITAFKHNLLRFYEYGIQRRMQRILNNLPVGFSSPSLFRKEDENDVQPVELKQMLQVMSIPFIGITLAVVIVIGERIYERKIQKKKTFNFFIQ